MTQFANRIPPPAQIVGYVTAMNGVENRL